MGDFDAIIAQLTGSPLVVSDPDVKPVGVIAPVVQPGQPIPPDITPPGI